MIGRPKKKDRQPVTFQVDRAHLNRMQGVNRSDIINNALGLYFHAIDHDERLKKGQVCDLHTLYLNDTLNKKKLTDL